MSFFNQVSKVNCFRNVAQFRRFASGLLVLGIETSCDDTCAAVVDGGTVLGEGYESQMKIHLDNGGVIPHLAAHFHAENIEAVVDSAISRSKVQFEDLSAIAVSTRPGLKASLAVGIRHAENLARRWSKPLVPVHHMEAHALTVRLQERVPFPFLCLLASGGHCQLTLVEGVDRFLLLGDSQHNSPGEVLDKIARRLKLANLPECGDMSGGRAVEWAARGGAPSAVPFPQMMTQHRDCDFSFSGFSSFAHSFIEREEKRLGLPPDSVIPSASDLCASLLHGYSVHMAHRLHRAVEFCREEGLLPGDRPVAFSGGVARNSYIRRALESFCHETLNCGLISPPPHLCTDNGVMVAWNGVERLRAGVGVAPCWEHLQPDADCALGVDIRNRVKNASIKVKYPKLRAVHEAEWEFAVTS